MNLSILFEDEFLIVVDKPPGIVVNRAISVKGETLADWAMKKFQIPLRPSSGQANYKLQNEEESEFFNRAGIVHRLDKDTSGVLLIAKSPAAFLNLQFQFKARSVVKKYITLVHGQVGTSGVIKAPVGRLPWNRERFGVLPGGREAETAYSLISFYKWRMGELLSLVNVIPHTGRTHQIRIHFKYIGHPVVADKFYGGRKIYQSDKEFCPRLFLHASFIRIAHPESGKEMEFSSNLPSDLKEVLNKLAVFEK